MKQRTVFDAIAIAGLIVLFTFALDRGWHWHTWRIPVYTLAVYLFSWTLERFPERSWVHQSIVFIRVAVVLAACWAEFHLPR
ncbi:MAG TPA: hypothetical protein VMF11_12660 [Candidatus Baltobacteraceae bacterium]|nr:hypothetical protein [Candidatus Baltobacteraceae bacterium]